MFLMPLMPCIDYCEAERGWTTTLSDSLVRLTELRVTSSLSIFRDAFDLAMEVGDDA